MKDQKAELRDAAGWSAEALKAQGDAYKEIGPLKEVDQMTEGELLREIEAQRRYHAITPRSFPDEGERVAALRRVAADARRFLTYEITDKER